MSGPRLLILAALLFVLFLITGMLARIYTDWMWFQEVGHSSVFIKMWTARLIIGASGGILFFLIVFSSIAVARRATASLPIPIGQRWIPIDDKLVLDRHIKKVFIGFALLASGIAALIASTRWNLFLKAMGAQSFHLKDPVFGKDVSFFLFQLPVMQFVWGFLVAAIVIATISSVGAYLYDDAIQVAGETFSVDPAVRRHLSMLAGAFLVLKSFDYVLERWKLVTVHSGAVHGAGYTATHVTMPALIILALIAFIGGWIVLLSPGEKKIRALMFSAGTLIIAAIIGQNAIPAVVQWAVVTPNELTREQVYLKRNIDFTRMAYGIAPEHVEERVHPAETATSFEIVRRNPLTFKNIRLWDADPLRLAYKQLQELRPYFTFRDVDVDRYVINRELRQVMLAARDLRLPAQSRSWVNAHLVYTHGFGAVVSPVNRIGEAGKPEFFVDDIPPRVKVPELAIREPRIYFSDMEESPESRPRRMPMPMPQPGKEMVPAADTGPQPDSVGEPPPPDDTPAEYCIVNTKQPELDYGDKTSFYKGKAGVPISGHLRRWAFAMRFLDPQISISSQVTSQSRIIFNRNVRDRVKAIAPFLQFDQDSYVVIARGRIVWILDAYTLGENFPYSQRLSSWNYIRNSVKAVVDAYDGTTRFYVADESDPVIKTYQKIFPGLFRPMDDIDRDFPGVRPHFRYPETLLAVQAEMLQRYHMHTPQDFYQNEDLWQMPLQPTLDDMEPSRQMSPYYVVIKPPGEAQASFMLIVPFDRKDKTVMAAWLAAPCDSPSYAPPATPRLRVYVFPKGKQVNGPMQVASFIKTQREISSQISLWHQRGSRVIFGNFQVLPVENTLLYALPLYLSTERAEQAQIPRLQKVVVVRPDADPYMADTLEAALEGVFRRGSMLARANGEGPDTNGSGTSKIEKPATSGNGKATGPPSRTSPASALSDRSTPGSEMEKLASEALRHYNSAERYRQLGNWGGYGTEMENLRRVLARMNRGS